MPDLKSIVILTRFKNALTNVSNELSKSMDLDELDNTELFNHLKIALENQILSGFKNEIQRSFPNSSIYLFDPIANEYFISMDNKHLEKVFLDYDAETDDIEVPEGYYKISDPLPMIRERVRAIFTSGIHES